jgi:hypothetical protein
MEGCNARATSPALRCSSSSLTQFCDAGLVDQTLQQCNHASCRGSSGRRESNRERTMRKLIPMGPTARCLLWESGGAHRPCRSYGVVCLWSGMSDRLGSRTVMSPSTLAFNHTERSDLMAEHFTGEGSVSQPDELRGLHFYPTGHSK